MVNIHSYVGHYQRVPSDHLGIRKGPNCSGEWTMMKHDEFGAEWNPSKRWLRWVTLFENHDDTTAKAMLGLPMKPMITLETRANWAWALDAHTTWRFLVCLSKRYPDGDSSRKTGLRALGGEETIGLRILKMIYDLIWFQYWTVRIYWNL